MGIFSDTVTGRRRQADFEIVDGQYVDGQRVGDVAFYRDNDGQVVTFRDHRLMIPRIYGKLYHQSIQHIFQSGPVDDRPTYDHSYGDIQ